MVLPRHPPCLIGIARLEEGLPLRTDDPSCQFLSCNQEAHREKGGAARRRKGAHRVKDLLVFRLAFHEFIGQHEVTFWFCKIPHGVEDDRTDLLTSFETSRLVNNVNLHWQIGQLFEFGTQIGARYAKSTIEGERYSGWSKLLGFDTRRELTPTLDVGGHATWLDAAAAGTTQRSAGFDFGISAARNVWISIGYNFEGFSDDHFDAARYTAQGPYVRFRMKIDQESFKDLDLAWLRPDGGADSRSAAAAPEPETVPVTTPP